MTARDPESERAGRARAPASRSGPTRAALGTVLGVAVGWLVLLRPSATLGTRLLACLTVTVVVSATLLLTAHLGMRRAGAWVAVLVGLVGGVGTGVLLGDAVVRGGSAAEVVAGAAGLVAGAVLVGSGAAALLGPMRARRRWVVVPVGLVLLQLVVQPVLAGVLASARQPIPATALTPADVGLEYEDLRLVTADQVELAAWDLPSSNGAAVVLLHGAGSTRAATLPHAEVLSRCGYGVLMLDARGHGDSAGLPMELGWFGSADVRAAVDALAARPEVDAIGLVGLSMGGEQALTAAAEDHRVRVVVAEGVGRRSAADAQAAGTSWHGRLERTVTALGMGIADVLSSAHPPLPLREAVREIAPRPMLLIAGAGEDEQVRWYREAAPGAVDVISLPGTAHVGALAEDEEWWRTTVCGRLDVALAEP
ncbi:alpha/beta hydrolase [Actinotalea sp. K2]|uniref:alpha/beta hydrolase n=1 Tax=Actinotalea sp. K2 TaxID=2939438 RepID=UPI002017F9E3|nr:alpha/beta hydrolase [Actinotalea sp. K2]MCL3861081.1 alpha/beta fold hydrolase [Actinotalea sp. K2]